MNLLNTISLFGADITYLEIIASISFAISVILANFRNKYLYPTGIIGTVLFFFVFLFAKLYSSAGLQIYLTFIQLYGWWFWINGDKGQEPRIGNWGWGTIGLLCIPATLITLLVSHILNKYTNANMAFWDTSILCLSVLAQFLLDRKQLKNWIIWIAVNVLSIYVYFSQHLYFTGWTYVVFLVNAFIGYSMWRKEYKSYDIR